MSIKAQPRIYVALDSADAAEIRQLTAQLNPSEVGVKVGKEAFTSLGPDLVRSLKADGFAVFLDLKFLDIPNTVAGACRSAVGLGVDLLNVHASGGPAMLKAAAQAVHDAAGNRPRPALIAVTVLTSMDQETLHCIGVDSKLEEQVIRLARLTAKAGLDGVVCSPWEAGRMRDIFNTNEAVIVTPGVRPVGSKPDDQHRIMTPEKAIAAGSTSLVIGRPITRADNPRRAVRDILATIQ